MPYTVRSAPPDVKRRFKGRCLEVWANVWNSTMKAHGDEGRSFATAEGAAQQCKGAKAEVDVGDETGNKAAGDRSFDELRQLVSDALRAARGTMTDLWVTEMYPDRVVYSEAGKYWEAPYTIADDGVTVTFDDRTEVERRVSYEPVAVKFAKGSDTLIEGLAIPFGGPIAGKDLDGEDFGPDTDLCLEWFPEGRPVLYHHGLNGAIKTEVVGRQTTVEMTDEGAWVKAELDKSSRWHSRVKQLVEKGALGFSSGAMPHLVKTRKDGHITRWPWVELTLTPTRANPYAAAYAVKSAPPGFIEDTEDDDGSEPEPFDVQGARVKAALDDFLERVTARIDARLKAGRELSGSNREWLSSLYERLGELEKLRREVKDALDRTDPEAKKAIESLEIELLVSDLRRRGVLT